MLHEANNWIRKLHPIQPSLWSDLNAILGYVCYRKISFHMCAKVKFTYPPRCGVYDRSGCSYCCPKVIRWPFIVWWIVVVGLAIVENRKGNKYLKQHVFPQMLSFLHWRMKGLDRVLVTLSLVASIYPLASRMKPATRAFSSCSLAVANIQRGGWRALRESLFVKADAVVKFIRL